MAFVDGEATIALAPVLSGLGTEYMTSTATAALTLLMSGDLVEVVSLRRAKAVNSTSIRVDFTGLVSNNSALIDPNNWKLYSFHNNEARAPTVLSVQLPPSAGAQVRYVTLITSEMHQGSHYILLVNSADIEFGANVFLGGEFESGGDVALWTTVGGAITNFGPAYIGDTDFACSVTMAGAGVPAGITQNTTPPGRCYFLSGEVTQNVGGTFRIFWRTSGGVETELCRVDGGASWADLAPSDGNRHIFYRPSESGAFKFMVYHSGTATGYYDALSARPVYGVGDSTANLITAGGLPLAKDGVNFYGVGVSPALKLVLANSATTATLYFTEPINTDSYALQVETGDFNFAPALAVVSIEEITTTYIRLRTAQQTPNELYQLTISGAQIIDMAGNAMAMPAVASMLGYVEPAATEPAQRLDMYRFILASIRDEDQRRGGLFLQRFFQGPQLIWEAITRQIMAVPRIWSLDDTPDSLLPYMKSLVGWTSSLNSITDKLDAIRLRQLIATSVPFWKQRGTVDNIEDTIRLLTRRRVRVNDWFYYRWLLGEEALGEDWGGDDCWFVSTPGEGADCYTYCVKIVDEGNTDYQLIRRVLQLTRPLGERVEVQYLAFAEWFETAGDYSQWDVTDATTADVVVGRMELSDDGTDEYVFVSTDGHADWTDYVATVRVRGTVSYAVDVYADPTTTNAYKVEVDIGANTIELIAPSGSLASVDMSTLGEALVDGVYYSIRVSVTAMLPGSPTNTVAVYWEAIKIIEVTNGELERGTIAVRHATGSTVDISMVEMFTNPMLSDFIDINS